MDTYCSAEYLEELLHRQIPVAKFMQVKVVQSDQDQVGLECDLAPNHNHIGTAFGGSLFSLMVLAAYCRMFQVVKENGHVVIKRCATQYYLPVQEKLKAICKTPSPEAMAEFSAAYKNKKRAQLKLISEIWLTSGRVACRLEADFVAVP